MREFYEESSFPLDGDGSARAFDPLITEPAYGAASLIEYGRVPVGLRGWTLCSRSVIAGAAIPFTSRSVPTTTLRKHCIAGMALSQETTDGKHFA